MPKGISGGKHTIGGGGSTGSIQPGSSSIQLNLQSVLSQLGQSQLSTIPQGTSVSVAEQMIMQDNAESVAIFGNDRRLLVAEQGSGGEVTLSGQSLDQYKNDIRVMTHNHPIDLPLSTGDLFAASKLGAATKQQFQEIRAVSKTGTVYRALKPSKGWPSEQALQDSIDKHIETAFQTALKARKKGASKDDAFQLYQDTLTNRVAKELGITLKKTTSSKLPITLANISQLANQFGSTTLTNLRSLNTGKPTAQARKQYSVMSSVPGEKPGAFPVFDVQSAINALALRGHTQTAQGRKAIITAAKQYTPQQAQHALLKDIQRGLLLKNQSQTFVQPKSLSRQLVEAPFKAAWWTTKTAAKTALWTAALPFRALAYPFRSQPTMASIAKEMTQKGLSKDVWKQLSTEEKRWLTSQMKATGYNENYRQARGLNLQNTSNISKARLRSLQTGKPTKAARIKYGFGGTEVPMIQGEKKGAFPIFDKQSAKAALFLKQHARTQAGKKNIEKRAKTYLNNTGIKLKNISQERNIQNVLANIQPINERSRAIRGGETGFFASFGNTIYRGLAPSKAKTPSQKAVFLRGSPYPIIGGIAAGTALGATLGAIAGEISGGLPGRGAGTVLGAYFGFATGGLSAEIGTRVMAHKYAPQVYPAKGLRGKAGFALAKSLMRSPMVSLVDVGEYGLNNISGAYSRYKNRNDVLS